MARQVKAIDEQLKAGGYAQMDSQFFAFQVWKAAYDRTVVHTALLHDAKKAGITISEDRLNNSILEYPEFFENGAFSLEKYRETTELAKLSIRNSLRDEMLKSYITDDALSLRPSSRETAFLKSMASAERVIEYVELPFSAFSDAEKAAYGRENFSKFRKVGLSRITLNDEKEAAAVSKVKDGPCPRKPQTTPNACRSRRPSRWGYNWNPKPRPPDAALPSP
jgi:hypothetical protein